MSEGGTMPFVYSPKENMSTNALFTGMLKVIEEAFDSLDPLVKTLKAKSSITRQKENVLYSMNELVKVLNVKFQQTEKSLTTTIKMGPIKCDATTQTESNWTNIFTTSKSSSFKFPPLEKLVIEEDNNSIDNNDKIVTDGGFVDNTIKEKGLINKLCNNKNNHYIVGNRSTIKMTNNINTLIQKINPSELIIGGGINCQQKFWSPTTSTTTSTPSESSLNSPDRCNPISSLFISNHHHHHHHQPSNHHPHHQSYQHSQHQMIPQSHHISPSSSSSSSSTSNYPHFPANSNTNNLIISSYPSHYNGAIVQLQQSQKSPQTNQDIPVAPPPPVLKCTNSSIFDKSMSRAKNGPPPPPRRSDKTRLSGRY